MPADSETQWSAQSTKFAAALLDAEKPAPNFLTSFNGANDQRRYGVYKNNVTVGLIRVMQANFPAIVRLIGEEYFTALARLFIEHNPPKTRILAQYGQALAGFLEAFEPLAEYPYLADVARLEQYWREAFHETDAIPMARDQLANVAPNDISKLCFKAHPAARWLKSNYTSGSIFLANRTNSEYQPIDPAQEENVLITRPHYQCTLRVLTPSQGTFVFALLEGETLGAAIQAAGSVGTDFDLAANISFIIEAGAFCEFSAD